jgi:hypothetical protein
MTSHSRGSSWHKQNHDFAKIRKKANGSSQLKRKPVHQSSVAPAYGKEAFSAS